VCDEAAKVCQPIFQAMQGFSVTGMSGQGKLLVGTVPDPPRAARWTVELGVDVLQAPASVGVSDAWDASADGSVIVGRFPSSGDTFSNTRPFRWTEDGGMVALPGAPFGPDFMFDEGSDIYATGSSADGSVIVGSACVPFPTCVAFRWTASNFEGLGDNGNDFSTATGVSADGAVVVGNTGFGTTPAAFRWTRSGGLVVLAASFDWHATVASAVSPDGATIIGSRRLLDTEGPVLFPERAVRWVSATSVLELPVPESWGYSIALDASTNAEVIVGRGGADGSFEQQFAWVWDYRSNEVRLVQDVLSSAGVDLTDWRLQSAVAVSSDGRLVAGLGDGPGGPSTWLARLP
jgi:uncharacterized membrane protein